MIDRKYFYTMIREVNLFDHLTQLQVDSMNAILKECEDQGVKDLRQVAYILATAYHECYNPKHPETRLTPITEFGGEDYLMKKPYYPYYGRGFSQLTWLDNYKKEAKRLGLDLINHPEYMLSIPTAANSHVYCMTKGKYTGKRLSDYINDTKCNYFHSRKVVNGLDKAALIMGYAQKFEQCLKVAILV